MARRRLLVVVNPNASRAGHNLGGTLAALFSAGFSIDLRHSDDRQSLARLIRAEGPAADAILIGGGDGTVNGALPALIEAQKPVGILPLGTANDLARSLKIPADPVGAARAIVSGRLRDIDVGRVNDVLFLNVASIGLSVAVAERQDPDLKRQLGALSYVVAAVKTLGDAERFQAAILCGDRRETVTAYQIAVGNGIYYGGGMRIAPDAAIDDGLLDIYAIETASIPDLIALAPAFLDGSLGERDDVKVFRGRTARIETETPMPVNTDGEVTTATPADFSLVRSALRVYAPR